MTGRLCLLLTLYCATTWAAEFNRSWEFCADKGVVMRGELIPEGNPLAGVRKYAPDRNIDVKHLKLEVVPNFEKRSIQAVATIRFAPIAKPLTEMELHAVDLRISKVESTHKLESYHAGAEAITFLFKEELATSEEAELKIHYSAEPLDGLFFRTPDLGYKEGDTHLWTQGEPEKHRYWFPSYDYPNERFTTEILCDVPEGMTVLSNGKSLGQTQLESGLVRHHWLQEQPHVNYLVSLVAGYFKSLEDTYRGIPLGFFTPPSDFPEAENSFVDTKAILEFYEDEIGVPYPWAKYYNVCVQGYPYGGMENTSVTTLTSRTLFTKDFENLRSSRGLDAHEIAHQWFGDLVTCKDWTHLWLNEGFATYYTELYEGHKFGHDHLLYGMYEAAQGVLKSQDDKPIAWREYKEPWEQFDYRAYPKGAWVLHMLRSQLGPDLYRQCIRTYLERHRFDVAVTEDLNAAIEDVSGRNFDRFFDQWVYHGGTPNVQINYSWDAKRKQARLSIAQTHKVTDKVLLFEFPLPVRFHTKKGVHDFTIQVTQASEDFYFELPEAPTAFRADPDYTLLAEIEVKMPNPMVEAQASLKEDVIGRLLAIQQLSKRKDQKSLELMEKALKEDPFFAVRMAAAKGIGDRRTEESLSILSQYRQDKDARVRETVVEAIGRFYLPEAQEQLQQVVAQETNPAIVTDALTALSKYSGDAISEALVTALNRDSYRHTIATGAIKAMRKQDQPSYVPTLLDHLKDKEDAFVDRDLGAAMRDLGYLARDTEPEQKEPVRVHLSSFLNSPRDQLIKPAIEGLSALKDPAAIAALEPISELEGAQADLAEAATKAIASLNEQKPQAKELGDLRKEVLDLQAELKKLRDDVEQMRKQAEPASEKK